MLRTGIVNLQRCRQRKLPPLWLGMEIRSHKNFGHKPDPQKWQEIAWHGFLTCGVILPWCFSDWFRNNVVPTYGVYDENETVSKAVAPPN